jgi:hypothetical protein
MNKVVFVKAYFAPVGKVEVFKVPTGEKKKGVFGGDSDVTRDEKRWVQTGLSDSEINTGRLTKDLGKRKYLLIPNEALAQWLQTICLTLGHA